MYQLRTKLLLVLFSLPFLALSQNCSLEISGVVLDKATSELVPYATISVEGSSNGVISDSLGFYRITDLCPGEVHLVISHVGCESVRTFVDLKGDTLLNLEIDHFGNILDQVMVKDHHEFHEHDSYAKTEISSSKIKSAAEKNFSSQLESIIGVRLLQNGGNISKPIINGLAGNRVSIMNNGVLQSGQQWGNDHAPEIDPFSAEEITVIKGAAAVEYPVNSIGGLILVEAGEIDNEPHLHGNANYAFESNGRAHNANLQLAKYNKKLAWKANVTARKKGDGHTPDYFLTNTGAEEFAANIKLEKKFSTRFSSDLYVSHFYSRLGILAASHISNLTNLELATNQEIPFGTESNFSYRIDPPSQNVNHLLTRWNNEWFITDNSWFDFEAAFQRNRRKEFDIRRQASANKPALSLDQYNYSGAVKYTLDGDEQINKAGIQVNLTQNININETDILPLIPNYSLLRTGGFYSYIKEWQNWEAEAGARLDFINQKAKVISQSLPREVISYNENYLNYLISLGVSYSPVEQFNVKTSLGAHSRSPQVNELYSNGLHQGVSGIELGDSELKSEQSLKASLSVQYDIPKRLTFQVETYVHYFENYIYLQPTGENRLTIRGAFPVFSYKETEALINGIDISTELLATDWLKWSGGYSLVRATNSETGKAIPFIPTDLLSNSLEFILNDMGRLRNSRVKIDHSFAFMKVNFDEETEFGDVPDAYNLLSAYLSTNTAVLGKELKFYLRIDNLLNSSYRSYTNRLRYFADERGRNFILGINLEF